MSFAQRWQEVRTGFERSFWVANFTELFERLAYYGPQAVFAIYLHERLGLSSAQTTWLIGYYGFVVWFMPVLGGALADRFGFRRTLAGAFFMLAIGNFLLGRLGFQPAEGHNQVHSPEELDMIFTESHKGGEINQTEFEILHRVVRFSDTNVRAVMVPRLEMQALPVTISRKALADFLQRRPHTRIPVYTDSLDEIVGVVNSKDLEHLYNLELSQELNQLKSTISAGSNGQGDLGSGLDPDHKLLDLSRLVLNAIFVPETIQVDRLLTELKRSRQQIAIIVNEYGVTAGLITVADILEQVFGDLPDEEPETEPDILQRPDGSIELSGGVSIDEVNELLGLGFPSEEAVTMSGLVINALGRTAAVGDEVEINGLHLRVEKMDRFRIARLVLSPLNPSKP